ncbi:MAG: acetylxylan esterase, partial [Armatimonadetes bacterium]|nr:acetylxylan esterase [Candidatus Hippobium faecium]
MKILLLAVLVLCCLIFNNSGVKAEQNIWNLKELSKAPDYTEYNIPMYGEKSWGYAGILKKEEEREKDKENNYVRAILYKGPDYKGRETRVFAYIGVPPVKEGKKVPGIVLVHGGGGGAFEAWVRLWNARGYAAIAMDTVGAESINEYTGKTMEQGCNSSWGDFANINEPIKDQWGYQAVANVILANSLLRSIPEIDKDNIGITGISWGGYLTCIASSVDTRFKYAIPIYGCGYLKDYSPGTVGPLFSQPQEDQDKWFSIWDPSVYLKERSVPIHWIVSNTDAAYYILGVKKSYECVPNNKKTLTIRDLLPHDHGNNGESQPETLAWADYYTYGTDRMPRITAQNFKNGIYTFKTSKNAVKAVLYTSKNPNPVGHADLTVDRTEFDFKEVTIANCCGQVKIPEDTKV